MSVKAHVPFYFSLQWDTNHLNPVETHLNSASEFSSLNWPPCFCIIFFLYFFLSVFRQRIVKWKPKGILLTSDLKWQLSCMMITFLNIWDYDKEDIGNIWLQHICLISKLLLDNSIFDYKISNIAKEAKS